MYIKTNPVCQNYWKIPKNFLTSRYRLPFELSLTAGNQNYSQNHSFSAARRIEIVHDRAFLAARERHQGERSAPGLVPNGPQEHFAEDIRDERQVEGRREKGQDTNSSKATRGSSSFSVRWEFLGSSFRSFQLLFGQISKDSRQQVNIWSEMFPTLAKRQTNLQVAW